MREMITDRCVGRWMSILPLLGIETRFLTGKHGPCPICQAGLDRWRFTDREQRGKWICNTCGHGDGLDLLMRARGWDRRQAVTEIESIIGSTRVDQPITPRSREDERRAMIKLWDSASICSPESLAGCYLASRGIRLSDSPKLLRSASVCGFRGMVAKIISPQGEAINLHRTFLTADARKEDIPRKIMQGSVPPGSAIRLYPSAARMGVAEGIETALSAAILFDIPVWSAMFADNLSKFSPPAGVEELVIFADHDANHHGQWAAECAARLSHKERVSVQVKTPATVGHDWNDVLMAET